jgi:hypothetical protein
MRWLVPCVTVVAIVAVAIALAHFKPGVPMMDCSAVP